MRTRHRHHRPRPCQPAWHAGDQVASAGCQAHAVWLAAIERGDRGSLPGGCAAWPEVRSGCHPTSHVRWVPCEAATDHFYTAQQRKHTSHSLLRAVRGDVLHKLAWRRKLARPGQDIVERDSGIACITRTGRGQSDNQTTHLSACGLLASAVLRAARLILLRRARPCR